MITSYCFAKPNGGHSICLTAISYGHFVNWNVVVLIAQTAIMEKRHTQMGARTRKFPCKNCIYDQYLDAYTVPILRFLQKTKVGDNLNNQSHLTVYNTKSALATLQLCYPELSIQNPRHTTLAYPEMFQTPFWKCS